MTNITPDIEFTLCELAESANYCFNEVETLEEIMQDKGIKPSQIGNWEAIQKLKKAAKPIMCEIVEVK